MHKVANTRPPEALPTRGCLAPTRRPAPASSSEPRPGRSPGPGARTGHSSGPGGSCRAGAGAAGALGQAQQEARSHGRPGSSHGVFRGRWRGRRDGAQTTGRLSVTQCKRLKSFNYLRSVSINKALSVVLPKS